MPLGLRRRQQQQRHLRSVTDDAQPLAAAWQATRCAAEAVSPVQCLLFVRIGIAGPQLSSTVRRGHEKLIYASP